MRTLMTMPPMQQSCVRSECRGIFTILSHRLAVVTTWSMKAAIFNPESTESDGRWCRHKG